MEFVYYFVVIVGSLVAVSELRKHIPRWYANRKTRIDTSRIEHDVFD